MNFVSTSPFEVSASTFMGGFSGEPVAAMVEFDLRPLKPGRDYAGVNYIAEEPLHVDGEAIREEYGGRMSGNLAFVGEMHLRKDTAPKIKRITLHVLDSKMAKLTSFRKESICYKYKEMTTNVVWDDDYSDTPKFVPRKLHQAENFVDHLIL